VDSSILAVRLQSVAPLMCAFATGKKFMKSKILERCRNKLDVVWIAVFLSAIKVAH
jgi:hypothetical protein